MLDEAVYLVRQAHEPATTGARVEVGAAPAGRRHGSDDGPQARAALLSACAGQRWIAASEHCDSMLPDLCRCAGFTPEIAIRTADNVAAQALVAAGLGVAIMPALALHAARHPGVEAVRLPGVSRRTWAVTYPAATDSRAVTRLREAIVLASSALE